MGNKTLLDESLEVFSGVESFPGVEEIASILALPDESFKIISEAFIEKFEQVLNTPESRATLEMALKINNVNVEQIMEVFPNLLEEVQTQLKDDLPQDRIDFLKQMFTIVFNAYSAVDGASKEIVQIPIELCNPDAKMPTYANEGDAGLDIYALEDIEVLPGETVLVKTGIKVAIPMGYELQVRPKSGRALKTKLRVANTPGTIDSGYRDEIGVIIENIESPIKDIEYKLVNGEVKILSILHGEPFVIEKGQKFAQLVLNKVPKASFVQVENINEIKGNRGGGFGSTGLN